MGLASKIIDLVSHRKEQEPKNPTTPEAHAPEASHPEFLDEENLGATSIGTIDERLDEERHHWRPRPLGDDLPLSG